MLLMFLQTLVHISPVFPIEINTNTLVDQLRLVVPPEGDSGSQLKGPTDVPILQHRDI